MTENKWPDIDRDWWCQRVGGNTTGLLRQPAPLSVVFYAWTNKLQAIPSREVAEQMVKEIVAASNETFRVWHQTDGFLTEEFVVEYAAKPQQDSDPDWMLGHNEMDHQPPLSRR